MYSYYFKYLFSLCHLAFCSETGSICSVYAAYLQTYIEKKTHIITSSNLPRAFRHGAEGLWLCGWCFVIKSCLPLFSVFFFISLVLLPSILIVCVYKSACLSFWQSQNVEVTLCSVWFMYVHGIHNTLQYSRSTHIGVYKKHK